jgi:phosphoribosylamine-glycine ligase
MTILLLGSGGREHALAYKMLKSPTCKHLFVAPGNAGTAVIATNVSISPIDFDSIKDFVLKENIDMVVVGPEDPLVHGIYDFFKNPTKFIKGIHPGWFLFGGTTYMYGNMLNSFSNMNYHNSGVNLIRSNN